MTNELNRSTGVVRPLRAAPMSVEERRVRILDAALEVFAERGYRGTSMEAIASAVGVTKPVVYQCYGGKATLFSALLDREESRLMGAVAGTFPAIEPDADPEVLLAAGLTGLFTTVAENPASWKALFVLDVGAEHPEIAERAARGRSQNLALLQEAVLMYLEDRGAPDARRRSRLVAHMVAGIVDEMLELILAPEPAGTPNELGRFVAAVLTRGVSALVDPDLI